MPKASVSIVTLADVPGVEERWSGKNKQKPGDVGRRSLEYVLISCERCGQESSRRAKDVAQHPERCGVCAGKILVVGYNDALTACPELAEVWDYERNPLPPSAYSKADGRKVWIKCLTCGQSNLRTVGNARGNVYACAVCAGKTVVEGLNDLTSQAPRLAYELAPRNLKAPETVYAGGRASYWWRCRDCHGEWFVALGWRLNGTGCPYCSNQRVAKGVSDLATTHPSMLEEWDYEKNTVTPEELTAGSNRKVWWRCEAGHTMELSPNQRWDSKHKRLRRCKACLRGIQSYGEEELLGFLRARGWSVESSARVLGRWEVDCYIPELKLGIEFNGNYWHSDAVVQAKYGIAAEEYHRRKLAEAEERGITLLFVWADDWYGERREEVELALQRVLSAPGVSEPLLSVLSKG